MITCSRRRRLRRSTGTPPPVDRRPRAGPRRRQRLERPAAHALLGAGYLPLRRTELPRAHGPPGGHRRRHELGRRAHRRNVKRRRQAAHRPAPPARQSLERLRPASTPPGKTRQVDRLGICCTEALTSCSPFLNRPLWNALSWGRGEARDPRGHRHTGHSRIETGGRQPDKRRAGLPHRRHGEPAGAPTTRSVSPRWRLRLQDCNDPHKSEYSLMLDGR
jgi:hypothetical protein